MTVVSDVGGEGQARADAHAGMLLIDGDMNLRPLHRETAGEGLFALTALRSTEVDRLCADYPQGS